MNDLEQVKEIKIADYTYPLPEERIARYPLPERDQSKLLVWENGTIRQDVFNNITEMIPDNAMLVFNNTRVIHARLFFRKETGALIEIFCLEPVEPADYQISFQEQKSVSWKCLVGNAKKWKEGILRKKMNLNDQDVILCAEIISKDSESAVIRFSWDQSFTFAEIIENAGTLPIPPYLNRDTEPADEKTYQTVYAKTDGSVAAPTAGLHFTEKVLNKLSDKSISLQEVTLHVGAGTFRPVKSDTIEGHTMHHEQVVVKKEFIENLLSAPGKIIAVGTTSVRTLESLYWLGLQLESKTSWNSLPEIGQWEPYNQHAEIPVKKALDNLLVHLNKNNTDQLRFSTQIIIVPGYRFRMIDGMVTNFHQPQSTLLLLIGAFLGDDWKKVYNFALTNGFRFLSYGDSNLYLK